MVKEKQYLYEGKVKGLSGKSLTIKQLSKAFDVPERILRTRFRGRDVVSDQNLLPTEARKEPRRVRFAGSEDYNGLEVGNMYTISEFARASNLNSKTMQNRLRGLTEADERHLCEARPKSNLQNSPFIHEADTARGHELNVISRAALKKPLIDQKVIASMGFNNERKWR
jgi:hypothetical protein